MKESRIKNKKKEKVSYESFTFHRYLGPKGMLHTHTYSMQFAIFNKTKKIGMDFISLAWQNEKYLSKAQDNTHEKSIHYRLLNFVN